MAWFKQFKGLDKQDVNLISAFGMGLGASVIGYTMNEVNSKYSGVLKYRGSAVADLATAATLHIASGMPILSMLKSAGEMTLALRQYITKNLQRLIDLKKQRQKYWNMLSDWEKNTPEGKAHISTLDKMIADVDAEIALIENDIETPLRLIQQLGIGMGLAAGFYTFWLGNNPDVVKQIVSSTEKVMIRVVDETSEVIDKTGEAAKDMFNGLLPDIWGLGWK